MDCQHCRAPNTSGATNCNRCGKPVSHTSRGKVPKKKNRPRNDTGTTPPDSVSPASPTGSTAFPPPAVITDNQADHQSTALALAPQTLPAVYQAPYSETAHSIPPATGNRPGWRRLAAGGCIAAAMALALAGIWKSGDHDTKAMAAANPPATAAIEGVSHDATKANASNAEPAKTAARPAHASVSHPKPQRTAQRHPDAPPVKPAQQTAKKKHADTVAKAPVKTQPVARPSSQEADGTILASAASVPQNRYAQCLEQDSFFSRERCKWQVCSGKWGQDGCPSYPKKDDTY